MEHLATVPTADDNEEEADHQAGRRAHLRIDPAMLAYLMGPLAFLAILVLMHFDYVEQVSPWVWLVVFVAIPTFNLIVGPHLRPQHQSGHPEPPGRRAGGGGHRRDLPDRLGPRAVGRLRLHRPRGDRQVRVPGLGVGGACGA